MHLQGLRQCIEYGIRSPPLPCQKIHLRGIDLADQELAQKKVVVLRTAAEAQDERGVFLTLTGHGVEIDGASRRCVEPRRPTFPAQI